MNAVILDGWREEEKAGLLPSLLGALAQAGSETKVFALREIEIAPCLGCFGCWIRTPGECVIDDDARRVARAVAESDVLILFTPVTFGGYSSLLKGALDRMIPNLSPFFQRYRGETHHARRYARPPSLAGLGSLPRPDREAERIFKTLVERNALNLQSPRVAATVVSCEGRGEVRAQVGALVEVVTR